MAKELSREQAHKAFESGLRFRVARKTDLSPIQTRVRTIVEKGLLEDFATATNLSTSRVQKIATGTQHAPDNENKRNLFMDALTQFEQRLGLT